MSGQTTPVHADAGRSERAAARRASSWAASLEAAVLAQVVAAGEHGLTAKEAREALGLPIEKHYSVAPRLSAMAKHKHWLTTNGLVRDDHQAYVATVAGRVQARTVTSVEGTAA